MRNSKQSEAVRTQLSPKLYLELAVLKHEKDTAERLAWSRVDIVCDARNLQGPPEARNLAHKFFRGRRERLIDDTRKEVLCLIPEAKGVSPYPNYNRRRAGQPLGLCSR